MAQPIERDIDLVPRLIERHRVFVQVDDMFDVLIVVVPPDQVASFSFDLVDIFFELEAIKTRLIHF